MAGRIFHRPLIEAVPDFRLACMVGQADAAATIDDPSIDLVVIATPNDTHAELAERALLAGKHVVIDKPFVLGIEDGERLIEPAESEDRLLTIFHNRRWDGDYMTAADLLVSGRLGEVALFEAYWDRFRPVVPQGWREGASPGAGTLWNLAPHLLDQLIMLFGMPQSVQADIACQRLGAAVDDYFALTFSYGRMRAVIGASNLIAQPRARFAIHGMIGSYIKYGLDPQEERLAAGRSPLEPGFGSEPRERYGSLSEGEVSMPLATRDGCYLEFYRKVAEAIHDGAPPPVTPIEALDGIRLLLAAQSSADERREVTIDAAQPI